MLLKFLICLTFWAAASQAFTHTKSMYMTACDDLDPKHPGITPRTSKAPFLISLNTNKITSGHTLHISIEGNEPEDKFKGGFIQGRSKTTGKILGSFIVDESDTGLIPLDCGNKPDSTLVVMSNGTNSLTVKWSPPEESDQAEILVTLMKNFATYWVAVPSEAITIE